MFHCRKIIYFGFVLIVLASCKEMSNKKATTMSSIADTYYKEEYRPQFHFSPEEKWMNDPNGLVYHQGVYHLFYQYYPDDIVWGPMHWGHAVSKDMMHWEHKPIALYPDKHGYIFSGSAVVDTNNTSGLGTKENPALVAIFTYHLMEGETAGRVDYQTQGIAFSLDNGDTWEVYKNNPVIPNTTGIKDFRDPKVFWNEQTNEWTMLLVAGDHLQIWSSPNLINWTSESEFGKNQGAHGGVWECPDLFKLPVEGGVGEKWVLFISVNPGAPNGGSGTQYFIGDFDGKTFTSDQEENKWVDWGTDNYAGVTYNNTPNDKRLFIGWMSNWEYARDTPTKTWRSAMTLPRTLGLKKYNGTISLYSKPIAAVTSLATPKLKESNVLVSAGNPVAFENENYNASEVYFTAVGDDFLVAFENAVGDSLTLHFDKQKDVFTLNRSASGRVDFQKSFANDQQMPMTDLVGEALDVRIFMDWSSIEIFINGGQHTLTAQVFPNEFYTTMKFENKENEKMEIKSLQVNAVKRVWRK